MKYTKATNTLLIALLRQIMPCLLLLALASNTAYGAERRFSQLNRADGLLQSSVKALVQDDYGFIWIGTEDGLARFDGTGIHIYRNDPDNPNSVQDNIIEGLAKDNSGRVWVTSEADGVSYYDYGSDSFIRVSSQLIGNTIYKIFSTAKSKRIFVHSDKGLFSIGADYASVRLLNPEQADSVVHVHEDDEHIHVTLRSGEQLSISIADNSAATHTLINAQISRAWTLDSCKTLFLANTLDNPEKSELYCHDGYQTKESLIGKLLSDSNLSPATININDIKEQADGTLWIATSTGLINIKNNELTVSKHLNYDNLSLSSNDLTTLYVGHNTLFIGTRYDGLNMLSLVDSPFTYLNLLNSSTVTRDGATLETANTSCGQSTQADYDTVWSILQATNGDLWVGNNSGLTIRKKGTKQFTDISRIGNDGNVLHLCSVWSLAETEEFIWIGIWGGVVSLSKSSGDIVHYKPQTSSEKTASNGLSGKFVRQLLHDKARNSLWIGTNRNGLNRLDLTTGEIIHYPFSATDKHQLPHGRVRSLYLGPDNRLWVGTGGGLSVWDESSNTFTTLPSSSINTDLSDEDVRTINHYKDDYYWIGTGNGINLFNASTFLVESRLNEKDGLANSTVYAMIPDNNGYYWITTANGLSKFDPQNLTFQNYTFHHGLQSNEFNFNAWAKEDNGSIFVGGISGLNVIDTNKPLTGKQAFDPVLSSIVGTDSNGETITISRFPDTDVEQIIPAAFRNVAFNYVFPAFNGDQPQSQHKLTASSISWSNTPMGSYGAFYTNLGPGRHYFQIKTSAHDDYVAQYPVYVNPTLWENFWFRLLLACTALAVLMSLSISYNRRRVNASLEALTQQHYYILEHELSPQLYQASSHLNTLSNSNSIAKSEKEYIDTAIRPLLDRSIRFLGAVKDMVDFETALTQPTNLYMLEDIVDEVLLHFDTCQRQIHVDPFDDVNICTHQDAVYLLLRNLLSNAIKYSDSSSDVFVKIKTQKHNLIVECVDSGAGIRADRRREIYKPYTRLKSMSDTTTSGLGLGLAIVKFITHTYDGEIVVEDNQPRGSRFIVTLKGVVTHAR